MSIERHQSGNTNGRFSPWRGKVALALMTAAAGFALFSSGSAFAWGFGEMRVLSALSEPFRTQIDLIGSDVAKAEKTCFKARLQGFDGTSLGTATVTFRENSHSLQVTTRNPVSEPAAALTVTYGCSPQMQREYAILLDLPIAQPSAPIVPARRNEVVTMPSSSSMASSKPAEAVSSKTTRRAPAAESSNDPNTSPSGKEPNRKDRRKEIVKPVEKQKNVLRLGDDQNVEDVTGNVFRQRLSLSYSLGAPPVEPDIFADAPAASQNAGAVGDQALVQLVEKIQALERKTEALQKLNAEQLNALDEAKKSQASSGSMYILYVLLLACALAIGWLIWRMRQVRSEVEHASWQEIVPDLVAQPTQDQVAEQPQNLSDKQGATEQDSVSRGGGSVLARLGRKIGNKAEEPVRPAVASVPDIDLEDPFAGMSVVVAEEILDEIQEAEFWVHMNQPERAISILETEAHPTSPLRWLHLFDLYRMVNDRERYELLAQRFKKAFNGHVAPWERSEQDKGERHIEEFPHVMAQIMEAWPTEGLVKCLEDLLLDNREGNRQGFDLPAYQDLLFLTNIAYQVQAIRASEPAILEPLDWPAPKA